MIVKKFPSNCLADQFAPLQGDLRLNLGNS